MQVFIMGNKIRIALAVLIVFALNSCSKKNYPNNLNEITQVKQTFSNDYFDSRTGNIINYSSNYFITRYNEFLIYQIPVKTDIATVHGEKSKFTIGDSTLSTGLEFQYYIWKDGDSSGTLFSQSDTLFTKSKFDVSAFLKKKSYSKALFFDEANDSLTDSKLNYKNQTTIKTYCPKIKKDSTYPDSTVLSFSKNILLNNFSLSSTIDSLFNMKLVSAAFIYSSYNDSVTKKQIPRREMKLSLDICNLQNTHIIKKLINSLEK